MTVRRTLRCLVNALDVVDECDVGFHIRSSGLDIVLGEVLLVHRALEVLAYTIFKTS